MPSAIAVLEIEVSTYEAAKLSIYVNKTTINASKFMQPPIAEDSARSRSKHETFKFEVPMRCLRSENQLELGVQGRGKELFYLHRVELFVRHDEPT